MLYFICGMILVDEDVVRAEDNASLLETAATTSNPPGFKEPSSVQPEPVDIHLKHPFGISSDITYVSRYVWHGVDYSNHKPTLQPEVILSFMKISAIVWLNYDIQSYKAINEYDFTLQYADKFGPVGTVFGYTYFTYPHRGWPDSEEVWIQGSYDNFFNPTLSIHDDFKSGKGWYYNLGISHGFELPIGNLTPSALLYYHAHYYERSGFPSIEFDLTDAVSIGQFTASPKISYYRALKDGDFKDMGNQFVYSFNLSWSFP